MKKLIALVTILCVMSCGEDPIPKPKAFLRLEYPAPVYENTEAAELPFTFSKNVLADKVGDIKISRNGTSKGLDIVYPSLKGTLYLTYNEINKESLKNFLIDAQNITQKHAQKAEEIVEQPYINEERKVFGMFYEVGGNAASQSQFYVTDSTKHFITGSLYFYVKPNYDSILPAAHYLKNDIRHLMESITWKD